MSNIDEGIAKSLTAESVELLPFLPYLLQDLWELGSSPKDIEVLIKKYINVNNNTKVIDLACGKGAVSVYLASVFNFKVKGIDIIPDFIEFANKKAIEYSVNNLCEFEINDINEVINNEKDYDIVILGAVGDVLGNQEATLNKLKKVVKKGGYMIVDDAYSKVKGASNYLSRTDWMELFARLGLTLIDEIIINDEELSAINNEQQPLIIKRAKELMIKHKDKIDLFESYIKSQQNECDELENVILGVTMLIKVD